MSRRVKFWIVAAVLLLHGGLFYALSQLRPPTKARSVTPRPTPNFAYDEDIVTDPQTGRRTIYREIRVSTKLADPATLPPRATPGATPAP